MVWAELDLENFKALTSLVFEQPERVGFSGEGRYDNIVMSKFRASTLLPELPVEPNKDFVRSAISLYHEYFAKYYCETYNYGTQTCRRHTEATRRDGQFLKDLNSLFKVEISSIRNEPHFTPALAHEYIMTYLKFHQYGSAFGDFSAAYRDLFNMHPEWISGSIPMLKNIQTELLMMLYHDISMGEHFIYKYRTIEGIKALDNWEDFIIKHQLSSDLSLSSSLNRRPSSLKDLILINEYFPHALNSKTILQSIEHSQDLKRWVKNDLSRIDPVKSQQLLNKLKAEQPSTLPARLSNSIHRLITDCREFVYQVIH